MNQNDILHAQVKDLQTQQNSLSEAINQTTLDYERWTSKRDHLNQQCQTLRNKVHNYKTRRNQFNDQIKGLKTRRETYKDRLHAIQQEYLIQEQILTTQQRKVTSNPSKVQQEIQRLEWSIQTSPYSAPQEQQIISRITALEHEAQFHGTITCLMESQKQRKQTMTQLTTQIKEIFSTIQQLAQESQSNHNLMLTKVKLLEQTQEAADHAHYNVLTQRTLLQKHQTQYSTLDHELQLLIQTINQNKNEDMQTSLHSRLSSKGSDAKKKIKAQKKISFNDFKVLKEKGYI